MTPGPARRLRAVGRLFGSGRLVALGLLLALLALRILDPAPIEAMRLRIFDVFQQLQPRTETNFPVLIVDIDEASIGELGQWPWPRTVLAEMVDRLAAAGAASIGFDIVFAEPDRTSPALLPRYLPELPPEAVATLRALPSNDAAFAASLARFGRAVLGEVGVVQQQNGAPPPPRPYPSVGVIGADPKPFLFGYQAVLTSIPELVEAAAGHGLFSLVPDVDGIVRRVPLFLRHGETIIPALSLETLRAATGEKSYGIHANTHGVVAVVIAGNRIPTDASARITVRFGPHDPRRFVSAADLALGHVDPGRIAGHIVLFGTSAAGLHDLRPTPIDPSMPGVEVHAQLLENVLSQTFLTEPGYALDVELLAIIATGIVLVVLVPLVGARWTLGLLLVLVAALAAASWLAFSRSGLLLDASYPIVSASLLYLYLAYTGFTQAEQQRKQVHQIFQHYISPAQVQRLLRDPGLLRLGGETKTMTVLFADIRDFTTISERFRADAQGLTNLINRVLTVMGDSVTAHEGTIDKYIGDSLMAFWNAPLDVEDHPTKACLAALDMRKAIERLNQDLRAEQGEDALQIRIGIGINTGECVVGNVGSERQVNYSVLGDPVNLASRVEGQSKTYGIPIILSEDTQREASGLAALEVDLIAVKGRMAAVRVYGLLGGPELANTEAYRELTARQERLLAAYRGQRWDAAEAEIEGCLAVAPELEKLYALYRTRIAAYRVNPPPPDWDGVFVATEK